jgi:hypothetical protein
MATVVPATPRDDRGRVEDASVPASPNLSRPLRDGARLDGRTGAPSATALIAFLGLTAEVEPVTGPRAWAFPLGVLYPYTTDLHDVAALFERISASRPDMASMLLGEWDGVSVVLAPDELRSVRAYLKSIRDLHSRICFVGGAVDRAVGAAYRRALGAISRATAVSPAELAGPARSGRPAAPPQPTAPAAAVGWGGWRRE